MAIEEKRRQLEQDKRKKEISQNRHQQEFSKAAFLQAINKVRRAHLCDLVINVSLWKWDSRHMVLVDNFDLISIVFYTFSIATNPIDCNPHLFFGHFYELCYNCFL